MADDIVTLRNSYALSMVERISELEAEVERLRVAGDALHDAIRSHNLTEAHFKAWQEARRG